jgi:hypothetical protein
MRDEEGAFVQWRALSAIYASVYRTYRPKALDIPGVLLVAKAAHDDEAFYRELDQSMGWNAVFVERPRIIQVPVTHDHMSDYDSGLGQRLVEVLEEHASGPIDGSRQRCAADGAL